MGEIMDILLAKHLFFVVTTVSNLWLQKNWSVVAKGARVWISVVLVVCWLTALFSIIFRLGGGL